MAETKQQVTPPGPGEAGRDRGARAGQEAQRGGAQETQRAGADSSRAAGAATRQGGEAAAEAASRSGQAAAAAQRDMGEAGSETARRSGGAAAEVTRRASRDFAEDSRRMTAHAAEEMEESAERYAEALRQMAQDVGRMMQIPRQAGSGMQDLQEAMGNLMSGMLRTNLRVTQELFRRASPGPVVELQGQVMREYIHTLMDGGATLLRATRRTADEALRPIEQQMERRNGEAQRNDRGGREQREPRAPRVAEVMTRDVRVVNPEETVQQAARLMGEEESGALPVGENDRLVGMVTDRDLAIRVLAEGKDPARTKVREVMTPETHYVFEDQDVDQVAESMRGRQLRRMPVLNREKRLVGIVSLGDVARRFPDRPAIGQALAGISREGGREARSGGMQQR